MTRSIHADTKSELAKQQYIPVTLVEIGLDSPLYLWTGAYDITLSGKTYIAAGNLLDVSLPAETTDLAATGFTVSLSGIPMENIQIAIDEPIRGKSCLVYSGVMKDGVIEGSLFLAAAGRCDSPEINESADSAVISVSVENRLIDLNRPRVKRYTAEQQRIISASDKACDFVLSLADKKIVWGAS